MYEIGVKLRLLKTCALRTRGPCSTSVSPLGGSLLGLSARFRRNAIQGTT